MDKKNELIDYHAGYLPFFTPSENNCFSCQKKYCLVEYYLRYPGENKKKTYYFCCDICFEKWCSQENIIIPLKETSYYFLATKPKQISLCKSCWPDGSYWTSQITNFYMFGKSKGWGICNNCEKDNCTVVGKVHFEWQDMTVHYYFCSASCGNEWWEKYGGNKNFNF